METYSEFKLKVLKKVSDLYLKHNDHPPIVCLHTGEGQNVLLPIPPTLFQTDSYKDIVPLAITKIVEKTKAQYLAVIMQCTLTQMEVNNLDAVIDDSEVGKSLKNKLQNFKDTPESKAPAFTQEEHNLLIEKLGEDRLIFLFQAKHDDDSFYSFTREESGQLKPAEISDDVAPFKGCFSNLFKK